MYIYRHSSGTLSMSFWVKAMVWNRVGCFCSCLALFWCALVSKWSFTSLMPCFAQDKARLHAVQRNLVGVPGIVTMHGHCWVHVLEKCVLYKNDPVYLDFLKVEGGTGGGLWALFFDALGTAVKVAEHSFGSLWLCHLPNHGKRKVAAHKQKLGKWIMYWWKILINR